MSAANLLERPTIGDWPTYKQAGIITGKSEGFLRRAVAEGRLRKHPGGQDRVWANGLPLLMHEREMLPLGHLCRKMWWEKHAADRSLIPEDINAITRDWSGMTGPDGGYLIPWDTSEDIWHRIQTSFEPLRRVKWVPSQTREFHQNVTYEYSRAPGLRWGQAVVRWGTPQGTDLSAVPANINQPQVGQVNFVCERLTAFGPKLSADLVADVPRLIQEVNEVTVLENAYMLMDLMIGGPNYPTPGLISGPGTIVISPEGSQTAGTIVPANIEKMYARLAPGCDDTACWLCNRDSMLAICQLPTTTSVWPMNTFAPRGAFGNPWPSILGMPLLVVEQCPPLGTPGDLILADLAQVRIGYLKPPNTDGNGWIATEIVEGWEANLMQSIERRRSEHRYFENDQHVLLTKSRVAVMPMWQRSIIPAYSSTGNPISPFVIIGQR
jgi:HK97 family phage major capsid protein